MTKIDSHGGDFAWHRNKVILEQGNLSELLKS